METVMEEEIQVRVDCQTAVSALTEALEEDGLRVYRSFDLQAALTYLPDCGCPHHGTAPCDCQYVILLVYDGAAMPIEIVAHGRDERTWLACSASSTLLPQIRQALTRFMPQQPYTSLPNDAQAT
jgi:uncharacterized protein (DUF302 family)